MPEYWDILDENRNKTGRLHKRGQIQSLDKPIMKAGDFHLVVHVWILNDRGEFLISKRTPNKPFPNMWECTGGSVIAGDDSLTTALKEAKEELGISLCKENGELFKSYRGVEENGSGYFVDVWIFRQTVNLADIIFQEDETCDARLVTKEDINKLIDEGSFVSRYIFPYLDELFDII